MSRIVKIIWVAGAFFVLLLTLTGYDGEPFSDIWILLTWFMLCLSFPAGLAVSAVHYALGHIFSVTIQTSYLSLWLEWLVYFFLGYFQWFLVLPWLWRKWKAR